MSRCPYLVIPAASVLLEFFVKLWIFFTIDGEEKDIELSQLVCRFEKIFDYISDRIGTWGIEIKQRTAPPQRNTELMEVFSIRLF